MDHATYSWSTSSGNLSITGNGPSVNMSSCCAGSYLAYVTATNACGNNYNSLGIDVGYCFARYSTYPNPASDQISIEFEDTGKSEALPDEIDLLSEHSTKPIKTINVQTIYQNKSFENGNVVKILTKELPRGTYYLHIKNSRRKGKELDVVRVLLQ